jgi:signal transduction histidine kinase
MENLASHKLLAKQLSKYVPEEFLANERFRSFVRAVNDSYENLDRDKELLEHSAFLNEREYAEINEKLKEEIGQRRQSVEKLIEAIRSLETPDAPALPAASPDDIVVLLDFLQQQIEHRNEIENSLRLAKEQAEAATRAKSEFLSMMSHEIRTPLNGIVGITYLMVQEDVPPAIAENLKTLQFSIEHLHALINDILDFSKIEAGKVELEEIPFDFKQLVSNIKRAQQFKAEENGNRIKLMVDDDIPDTLLGDPVRIGQVLTNLVSNAIKFTRQGTITIELSLQHRTDREATVFVSVRDTGIGIPAEKQAAIFEMFTQANSATTRQYGGTGLGLVITRRLLNLYDSDIHLVSEEGRGSEFSFTLTLPIGAQVRTNFNHIDLVNEHTLKGLRVLLVEDYPVNVKVALKFLSRWGVAVDTAENGLVGFEKFQTAPYDLVLMDLQMPVMDGYTSSQKIRELNDTVPIIALTASATYSNKDRAIGVGINDYVTKPFNPNELFQKIARYCQRVA